MDPPRLGGIFWTLIYACINCIIICVSHAFQDNAYYTVLECQWEKGSKYKKWKQLIQWLGGWVHRRHQEFHFDSSPFFGRFCRSLNTNYLLKKNLQILSPSILSLPLILTSTWVHLATVFSRLKISLWRGGWLYFSKVKLSHFLLRLTLSLLDILLLNINSTAYLR